jgi:hypothetical protein
MKSNGWKSWRLPYVLILLISIFTVPDLKARGQGSLVKGVVHNLNNEPLSGVSVVIRNAKTNFTTGTTTDSSGNFSFSGLTSGGPYKLTFSKVGFEKQTMGGYTIKPDATLSLVVKMKNIIGILLSYVQKKFYKEYYFIWWGNGDGRFGVGKRQAGLAG